MPVQLASSAVVLKTIIYSDSSLIVRLFTEQFGKVTVIARGARRPKRSMAGILQPPNHIMVGYKHKESRDVQTLTSAEFIERYPRLSGQLDRSAAALVAIEMLDRAVQDADPHALLFRLITATLRQLEQPEGDAGATLHFYQLHLARQLGFRPHLDTCVHCGKPLKEALLDLVSGHLSCLNCRQDGTIRLGQRALEQLRAMEHTHINKLGILPQDLGIEKQVGNFLLNYLYYHVDGMSKLNSIKFLRQVQA